MNRGELLTEIGRRLVELKGSEGMWDPTERDDALHSGQIRVVTDLELLRAVKTAATVIDKVDYALIADFGMTAGTFLGFQYKKGLVYYDGVADVRLVRRSEEWLYEHTPTWRTDGSGTPSIYYPTGGGEIFNNLVGLYPKPATALAAALRAHVLLMPARMTADGHYPFHPVGAADQTIQQFPSLETAHYALVWMTVGTLLADDDPRLADRALQFYAFELRKARAQVFAPVDREPGSVRVVSGYRQGRTW